MLVGVTMRGACLPRSIVDRAKLTQLFKQRSEVWISACRLLWTWDNGQNVAEAAFAAVGIGYINTPASRTNTKLRLMHAMQYQT